MSIDLTGGSAPRNPPYTDVNGVGQVPRAGTTPTTRGSATAESQNADRERLTRIAQEFESMLLVQVLRDMRRAGSWADDESGASGFGFGGGAGDFGSLFETIDVELASHLSRAHGLGLSRQLEEAFDRLNGGQATRSASARGASFGERAPYAPTHEIAPADRRAGLYGPPSLEAHSTNPIVTAVRTAAEATVAAPRAVAQWVRPVAGAVTSAFGWRQDPFTNEAKFHKGVDLRAAYGQEVQAAGAGRVVFSGEQGGYGTTVVLEHEDGTRTRYAHLSARTVEKGDRVEAGAVLGRAGRSGRATGTHLHFEVIAPDGRRIQPDQVAGLLGVR